jgi:hypothetical protein
MMSLLKFADARMGEPSTWAALAAVLGLLHVNIDPGLLHTISLWGSVGAGVLGVILTETGAGKPALQVASDSFAAFVAAIKAMPPPTGTGGGTAAMLMLLAGLTLGGCAGTQPAPVPVPKSPDQALYDANATYVAALMVVTDYGALPRCPGTTWGLTCHNAAFLVSAQRASNAAAAGLADAKQAVTAYDALAAPAASDTAHALALVTAAVQQIAALQALMVQIGPHS